MTTPMIQRIQVSRRIRAPKQVGETSIYKVPKISEFLSVWITQRQDRTIWVNFSLSNTGEFALHMANHKGANIYFFGTVEYGTVPYTVFREYERKPEATMWLIVGLSRALSTAEPLMLAAD